MSEERIKYKKFRNACQGTVRFLLQLSEYCMIAFIIKSKKDANLSSGPTMQYVFRNPFEILVSYKY